MIKLIMDQKDLKLIAEIVRGEILKNNFMQIDLMDVKLNMRLKKAFEENNKVLIALMDVKLKNLENKINENFDVKMLEWKSDIVDAVDTLAKEISDEREFRDISSHQIGDNTRRIEILEKGVFGVAEV